MQFKRVAVDTSKAVFTIFVKRAKNDRNDAEAISEAASRPDMRFVPVKSATMQAESIELATRQLLVQQRTQLLTPNCMKRISVCRSSINPIPESALVRSPRHWRSIRADDGRADRRGSVQIRPTLFGLARSDAKGAIYGWPPTNGRHHPSWS
jgi:transposase